MITFKKKKGKYFKQAVMINRIPYYLLVEMDEFGNIKQVIEKPNFKEISEPQKHHSGLHIIADNPIENHYDHTSGAMTADGLMEIKEWKEYPIKEGKEFGSRYSLSGSVLAIAPHWNNPASFAIVTSG